MIDGWGTKHNDRIRLLAVAGSTSATSFSGKLARLCLTRARASYPMVDTLELDRDLLALPIMDSARYRSGELLNCDHVRRLHAEVQAAHAYVLVTPVQHGSYSGALKNLLDHLPHDAFAGKPVMVAACAAGLRSTQGAREHLQTVVRALGGWSTPTSLVVETSDYQNAFPAELHHRIDHGLAELVTFSSRFLFESKPPVPLS